MDRRLNFNCYNDVILAGVTNFGSVRAFTLSKKSSMSSFYNVYFFTRILGFGYKTIRLGLRESRDVYKRVTISSISFPDIRFSS